MLTQKKFCSTFFFFLFLADKGDYVNQDDIIVVIETDKVSVDVRAPAAGVLLETLANAGESFKIKTKLPQNEMKNKQALASCVPKLTLSFSHST